MNPIFFRSVIKISGESGSLSTAGNIVIHSLRSLGLHIYCEREFPSLIKGGRANIQINYASQPIRSMSHNIPIGVALDREGVLDCLDTLATGGILIHGFDRWNKVIKNLPERTEAKKLQVLEIPAREIAAENGGGVIMVNTVLIGVLYQVLGLEYSLLEQALRKELSKKPVLLETNLKCAKAGFEFQLPTKLVFENSVITDKVQNAASQEYSAKIFVDGNSAIALGTTAAGCRAYYAYPMSPATTVLVQLAKWATESGMLVKQVEDEITAAQMVLGSMHAGTRAFTMTSGGGFDLMTETVSLAGIIETPIVIGISQRPGPGTGLPTWTAQGDLSLAIHSGHGEYAKCVLACSDPVSAFENIQLALNISEKYQIPTILLTEANIAMSSVTIDETKLASIQIQRGLVESEAVQNLVETDNFTIDTSAIQRYQITESGISPRWLPGSLDQIYYANGDEHTVDGSLTEDADMAGEMYAKRIRKTETLLSELPEPVIYGVIAGADVSFIGWGSTKNAVLDTMDALKEFQPELKINYLHYNFVYPLKTGKLLEFMAQNKNIILIEGNATGQLGELIAAKTGVLINNKMLKWNGRPFYVEEIMNKCLNSGSHSSRF